MISFPSTSLRRTSLAVWPKALVLLAMVVFVDATILGEKRTDSDHPSARSLGIRNESGRKVDMVWVNKFKTPEEYVPQFVEDGVIVGCAYGASKSVSSFTGHEFEIREVPSKKTERCVFQECRKVRYTVTDRFAQEVTLNRDFTITIKDNKERVYTKAEKMFTKCQEKVESEGANTFDSIGLITKCMEEQISEKIEFDRKERVFHSTVQRNMATDLIPFECADVNKTLDRSIKNVTWNYDDDSNEETSYNIQIFHKVPTSEILVVDDFISKKTCNALELYREVADYGNGEVTGVPSKAAQKAMLLYDLFYKMYAIMMDQYKDWRELDFKGDILFEYIKDMDGFITPLHLCNSQEEVDEVVAMMDSGELKKCRIPGGIPEAVPTKRFVVEEGVTEEEKKKKRQLAQLFFFCDEPKHRLGGLHFPYAGTHVPPKTGRLVVAVNRHDGDRNDQLDGYVDEYHMCPNHEVYVHTVFDHKPVPIITDIDEGEL